ncbi:MAG: hypothetical protein J5634_03020 [Bacilli bacterium]|nr:hypothetical protein [Bacilli bacterium]
MEDLVYYNELFEIYENLLTDKEVEAFKDYYFEDLSLSEIADNKKISRAAVSKMVKNVIEKLDYYESKIHKYQIVKNLKDLINENNIEEIKKKISEVVLL